MVHIVSTDPESADGLSFTLERKR